MRIRLGDVQQDQSCAYGRSTEGKYKPGLTSRAANDAPAGLLSVARCGRLRDGTLARRLLMAARPPLQGAISAPAGCVSSFMLGAMPCLKR